MNKVKSVAKQWRFVLLNILSFGLIAIGLLLYCLSSVLPLGINDGEWGKLLNTETYVHPNDLVWGDWQPNDGSVERHPAYHAEESFGKVTSFRIGKYHGWLFDFVAYEGKVSDGSAHPIIIPAFGPHWGASFHKAWAIGSIIVGIAIFIFNLFLTRLRG